MQFYFKCLSSIAKKPRDTQGREVALMLNVNPLLEAKMEKLFKLFIFNLEVSSEANNGVAAAAAAAAAVASNTHYIDSINLQ